MSDFTGLIGKPAPKFELEGVKGGQFHAYKVPESNGKWTVLLFYPLDFTFVCPTEVIAFSEAADRFAEANTQIYGISVDSKFTHLKWTETKRNEGGVGELNYPLLADLNKQVANQYGILLEAGITLRGLFIIDNEGVVQHATINNLGVGRSVDETIRLVQAFQFVKKSGEVCPANWNPGDSAMKPDPTGLKNFASTTYVSA